MASGATVKLGVEGISQFKNNMNQAKQAVKTLDAQLSLSEKQFKQTGDAESYMTEKTELLKAKLEQQKSIVDNAQKALDDMASRGVDRASKAYQDMYRQMVTAKGAMIDTENQLNGVADSGDKAADGVSEMNAQLKRVGDGVNFQQVTTGLGKITDGLEKAAKKAINLGKKIAGAMIEAGGWADDLQTRAANYGMSPEQLQRMEKTSLLIDTSVDAIVNAQKKLKKGLGKEDKEVLGSFVELLGEGYDPRSRGWENAFWDAGEALMKFTDEEEKEVYAQKLFGRSWAELIPLFQAGREEYEKTNESWKVVSQESVDNLQKMQDEYDKLMADWDTFKYEALAQFAEPMRIAFEAARDALGRFMGYLQSEEGQKLVDNIVTGLKNAIEWISKPENIETAIGALKAIIIGWSALLAGKEALQIMNFINGAKGLFGGGGGSGGADKVVSTGGGNGIAPAATGTGAAAGSSAGSWLMSAATKVAPAAFVAGTSAALWFGLGNIAHERDWGAYNRAEAANAGKESALMSALSSAINGDEWEQMFRDHADELRALTPDNPLWELIGNFADLSDGLQNAEIDDLFENWSQYGIFSEDYIEMFRDAYLKLSEAAEDLTGGSDAQKQSSSEMTEAAGTMKGLPGMIQNAIVSGMSQMKVYVDGQPMAVALTPYVNTVMATLLAGQIKP